MLGVQVFYDAQTRREVSTAEGAEAVRRASYGPAKRVLLETLLALEQPERGVDHRGGAVRAMRPLRPAGRAALPESGADALLLFPRSALIWRRWPGRSWASSCCGRPMGCRSTMWRWPPFWSGEGQKTGQGGFCRPGLCCCYGQDQK